MKEIEFLKHNFKRITDTVNRQEVSEWAEQNRVLPQGLSPMPGPWNNDITPYSVEIMNCFSANSDVRRVSVIKGAQLGLTVGGIENIIGYNIDTHPGPMAFVSADEKLAKAGVELRIDSMLSSCGLQEKIFNQNEKNSRKTGSTSARKDFPGGFLMALGAKSPNRMRSISFRDILVDELDAVANAFASEGNIISLLEGRTQAYDAIARMMFVSTPLIKGTSLIEEQYLLGDQRKYFIPCPKCGHEQVLEFKHLKYTLDKDENLIYDSVHYECQGCKHKIKNDDKVSFLKAGRWIPTAKPQLRGYRSYHISSLYSPIGMLSWESVIEKWLFALKDVTRLQSFTNIVLGETWEERSDAPDLGKLQQNRKSYFSGEINENVVFLTCGADVQADRIECELVGWCKDQVSYSIDYKVFEGDTKDHTKGAWVDFEKFIESEFKGINSKSYNIILTLIDRGYLPDVVHDFCSQYEAGVLPVMGIRHKIQNGYFKRVKMKNRPTDVIEISPNSYKNRIFGSLRKDKKEGEDDPYGWINFPFDYEEKYFKMLTNEKRIAVKTAGGKFLRSEWVPKYSGARNEALDCKVYNSVAADFIVSEISTLEIGLENSDWNDVCDFLLNQN